MKIKSIFVFVLLFAFMHAAIAAEDNTTDDPPVKPSVSVSFSRQLIREDDAIEVDLWIGNDSNYQLLNVEMHVAGPDFLTWHEDTCEGRAFTKSLGLGSINPRSVLRRQLCVKTTSLIKVGEFNTLFTFKYEWKTDRGLFTSLVTFERTIKSHIFGSDSVAGIPLAFAGFVVPGLFFWFVITFFRAPWNVGLALGDKLIYSVLVSSFIVGVGQWISLIDVTNGISINKLTRLAITGVILGAIVGSADYLLRRRRERKAAAKEIGFGDDENTLLGKLLQLNPRVKPGQAIVVRLKNGEKYMGSLFSYSETITSLVGWFKINLEGQSPEFLKKMKTLQRNGQLYGLFSAAQQYGLEVKLDDAIQQWMEDDYDNTGDGSKQWNNDEVAEITVEPEGKSGLPLRLVE